MIKKDKISAIEKLLGLADNTISDAISKTEEVDIDIPELFVSKKSDYETLVKNIGNENKKAGAEILLKSLGTEFGVSFDHKVSVDDKGFVSFKKDEIKSAITTKTITDAKIAPDARITELEKDLGIVKGNWETEKTAHIGLQNTIKQERNESKINSIFLKEIPDNTIIPKEDVLDLFKRKNQYELTDAGVVFKNGDEVLKNSTTRDPLGVKDVMGTFLTPYLKSAEGGAGGSDSRGNPKAGTLDDFNKRMEAKGYNEGDSNYMRELTAEQKAGTVK